MWYVFQVVAGREDALCERCKKAFLGKEVSQVFVSKYVWLKKVNIVDMVLRQRLFHSIHCYSFLVP